MFDGIFTHYLIKELQRLENVRINKVNGITACEFFFTLSSRNKLFISVNSNSMHLRITTMDLVNSPIKSTFFQSLKKYLESSIINKISQFNNERIIIMEISHFDELGYIIPVKLVFEMFGRNSNIILIDQDNLIIDCYRRLFDNETTSNDNRIVLPRYNYLFPRTDRINPYIDSNFFDYNNNIYQGVSNLLYSQLVRDNSLKRIYSEVNPTIIKNEKTNKYYYYCFDLPYIEGPREHFDSLSEMLEYFYTSIKTEVSLNNEQLFINNYINKEIAKINEKIRKQEDELANAHKHLSYQEKGNLLASNLHLIKRGDKSVIVEDYYNNNQKVEISLDPLLSPKKNLENIFNKYQKAKRAIMQINNQLEISKNDLQYYHCLLNQLSIAKANDIIEILKELNLKQEYTKNKIKKQKPSITIYKTSNDDIIYVGKNNTQNNYITHQLANNFDYFFHVQAVPGSHVIVKTKNLTEDLKNLAASIAAYYSTSRNNTNVCVDYTLVKNIKKVPGIKGSFVIYSTYQSIFVKPDIDYIKKNTIN